MNVKKAERNCENIHQGEKNEDGEEQPPAGTKL